MQPDAPAPTLAAAAAVLPGRADDLARLGVLAEDSWPVVTVIGKYNHGKSRLLNELIGQEVFAVADRRETVALADIVHQRVRWLDAPGLDASADDDGHARRAAWLLSDIRLFVHAAKAGELDRQERELLAALRDDDARTHRQTLVVLTQVDQLADEAELQAVRDAVAAQAHSPHLVSAVRHRKGLEQGKPLLVERSGIPALRQALAAALAQVPRARAREGAALWAGLRASLQKLAARQADETATLHAAQRRQREDFDRGLRAVLDKAGADIAALLASLGPDRAAAPDSAQDAYALTPGKAERNKLQIGYSRACIGIDSYLASHGVAGMPGASRTPARSLNSVMAAVLGVSVKFRKDLRRMFCEPAGRLRLQADFTHYYELSDDRQALAARIAELDAAQADTRRALDALHAPALRGMHTRDTA